MYPKRAYLENLVVTLQKLQSFPCLCYVSTINRASLYTCSNIISIMHSVIDIPGIHSS